MDEINASEIADEIRNIINWVKIFEEEYNIPSEVVSQLMDRLDSVVSKLK